MRSWVAAVALVGILSTGQAWAEAALPFESQIRARLDLRGPLAERIQADGERWLLSAPQANPGMLDMFRVRDRQPVPELVPWAGEFAGKYLFSAVQSLQLAEDPRLRVQVEAVVRAWLATQAEDGYLGPFPKEIRLLKHWDLWGHYHAIEALLRWEEYSGDASALAAAKRAGDLVCATYLAGDRRVLAAGDPEMNMAILTALAHLHRRTGEARYLQMAREVERDWEQAGDYLRAGLDGREFFQSPRPRWESLHDLQGLLELYRITGELRYADAFQHHWRSIRRWDQRNTGGFSSGEQATGNPYAATPIETCCTVAWIALTIDQLRLTGDSRVADVLELATLNGGLGAQHPSGRWWTYNTPMDGAREASAHTIVFQARAGTPELNCCSVNGPRVLGSLADWALMSAPGGLALNWLGAGQSGARLADGTQVYVRSSADAWLDGTTELQVTSTQAFRLQIRIPAWASQPKALLNGEPVPGVVPGRYLELSRRWSMDDKLTLNLGLTVRAVAGANETAGRVSLYRGPVLLTFDPAFSAVDGADVPAVNLERLAAARVMPASTNVGMLEARLQPWIQVDVPATNGSSVRLVDFASAGAHGTRYRTWLPASPSPVPPAFTLRPADAAHVPVGPVKFRWRGARNSKDLRYRVEVAADENFQTVVASRESAGREVTIDTATLRASAGAAEATRWFWRVVTKGAAGETAAEVPPAWFIVDPAAAPVAESPSPPAGPDGELIAHSMRGDERPRFGEVVAGGFVSRDSQGTVVNGRDQMVRYRLGEWPEEDYTVLVRVRVAELPAGRIGQVFSAWCGSMDDPLRLVVDSGKLHARVEAGGVHSTGGFDVAAGRWYSVAAVKRGPRLTLFVDGKAVGSSSVPQYLFTQARGCALGGNPNYGGNECLSAAFADFGLFDRALSDEQIREWTSGAATQGTSATAR